MQNAGLLSFEPYQLYRHDVVKVVEPGVTWQPTGVPKPLETPWYETLDGAGRVATRARYLVLEMLGLGATAGAPLPDDLLADGLDSIYVTVYMQGHLRGCMGTVVRHLEHDLGHLVRCALQDPRFSDRDAAPDDIAVTVSFLYNPLTLGSFSPEEVVQGVRHGQQALMVYQGTQVGLLLPFIVASHNLTPLAYAREVIDKAGIRCPPYTWRRFDCTTWLADRMSTPRPLQGALPLPPAPPSLEVGLAQLATLLSQYLLRHQRNDGRLFFHYLPHQDILYEGGDLPRTAHGAWVLCRAGQRLGDTALQGGGRQLTALLVSQLAQDQEGHYWLTHAQESASVAEVSFLLLALCSPPGMEPVPALVSGLAATLWSRFTPHGRIATHREPQPQEDVFQDFFPGQVLLALAHACRVGRSQVDQELLSRAFDFYRHRFRYKRCFAQVSWHMQAFTAWWHVLREPDFASYVFEIADWLVGYQQTVGGGFINEEQQDTPGYTTALYLEGLGAATRLAEAVGDHPRATRYRAACEKGFRFVHGLVIQEPMTTLLPNPAWAIGGVRTSLVQNQVRIDFVQHALSAVLELHPHDAIDWET
jgi:AMMECR1 domain-containing protein